METLAGYKKTEAELTPTWEANQTTRKCELYTSEAFSLFGDFNFVGKNEYGWKLEDPDGEVSLLLFLLENIGLNQPYVMVGYDSALERMENSILGTILKSQKMLYIRIIPEEEDDDGELSEAYFKRYDEFMAKGRKELFERLSSIHSRSATGA